MTSGLSFCISCIFNLFVSTEAVSISLDDVLIHNRQSEVPNGISVTQEWDSAHDHNDSKGDSIRDENPLDHDFFLCYW